jgi:hypothetical protein
MKKYKYTVIYLNDQQDIFYCNGFVEAIILAMARAIENGRDFTIKYITDEKGVTIRDIKFPTYNFSK